MQSHVMMGRDDSYILSEEGIYTIQSYHEAYLEDDVVVREIFWYDGKPGPNAPSLLIGKTARHLREAGFRTWQMGLDNDWRRDVTLVKVRAALKFAKAITGLQPFLSTSEYLHVCDTLCRRAGVDVIDFEVYSVSHLSFLFAAPLPAASGPA